MKNFLKKVANVDDMLCGLLSMVLYVFVPFVATILVFKAMKLTMLGMTPGLTAIPFAILSTTPGLIKLDRIEKIRAKSLEARSVAIAKQKAEELNALMDEQLEERGQYDFL